MRATNFLTIGLLTPRKSDHNTKPSKKLAPEQVKNRFDNDSLSHRLTSLLRNIPKASLTRIRPNRLLLQRFFQWLKIFSQLETGQLPITAFFSKTKDLPQVKKGQPRSKEHQQLKEPDQTEPYPDADTYFKSEDYQQHSDHPFSYNLPHENYEKHNDHSRTGKHSEHNDQAKHHDPSHSQNYPHYNIYIKYDDQGYATHAQTVERTVWHDTVQYPTPIQNAGVTVSHVPTHVSGPGMIQPTYVQDAEQQDISRLKKEVQDDEQRLESKKAQLVMQEQRCDQLSYQLAPD